MQSDKAFLTALKICILYVIILLVSHKSDVIDVASPIIDVDKKEAFTLESEGLIVVDVLDEEQIEVIRSYFLEDQSIDYDNLKKYLLSFVKEKIDTKLGWDVQFNTYRCSNGKHIVGASGFHRDQLDYTSAKRVPPCFTVIVYLDDDSFFEYIPRSHLYRKINPLFTFPLLSKSKVVKLKAGSIVLMYGTVVHRALSFPSAFQTKRRVIQFFGTLPSPDVAKDWRESIVLSWNDAKQNGQSQWIKNVLPVFNFFYSMQQMCRISVPGMRNYVPPLKRDGKLIIPYAMPVRKNSEKDDNLYVMVNESDLDFYF